MDYAFAKEHEMIKNSVREFFSKACPKDLVRALKEDDRGYDKKMWKKMLQLGYQGLVIPEQYGGLEGDFIELAIFMEEAGRNIVPSPFFTTVVQCGLAILDFGSTEQKDTYLPGIAEQGEIWSWAVTEAKADDTASEIQLKAERDQEEYILDGVKLFVPFANSARYFLVAARTDQGMIGGISLFIVDAKSEGISMELIPTAAHDRRFEVSFNQVRIPEANRVGTENGGWPLIESVMRYSAILKAAEMSGGAQAVLQMTVNYAKERKQFDKPLGSFQALQHRMSDLLTQVEGLKYMVYRAAWLLSEGEPSDYLISAAKAKANAVYHDACYQGIIMHGAIGWTEEMDIGLYHIRTRSLTVDGGGSGLHQNKMADILSIRRPDCVTLYES